MRDLLGPAALLVAGACAIAAFVLLSMERHVAAGTFFIFTALGIYVRETRG